MAYKHWWGFPNGNERERALNPGPDTGPASWRDDDPQSAGSSGRIYDLDNPGSDALFTNQNNMIKRYRVNFRAWAVYDGVGCSETIDWYTRHSYKLTGPADVGTATSGGFNTLTDSTKTWTANVWAKGAVKIYQGTGGNPLQVRKIVSNTATQLTVETNWFVEPDETSKYFVISPATWVLHNDVANDNRNADGTTKTKWNLQ